MDNKITIGIPTYKRPDLLERSLNSLNMNLESLKIIVSVNGNDEDNLEAYKKVEIKYSKYKNIKFYYQKKNIGTLNNFYFLRDNCNTEFFMWLADDDETNIDGIIEIKEFLNKNKDYSSGCLMWELVNHDGKRKLLKPKIYQNDNVFIRILSYITSSDDALFYGLHRTENLKKCNFINYWWPNKKDIANWCYVFQFDLIIQGKIFLLDSAKYKWTNHDYGTKHYYKKKSSFLKKILKYFLRRFNVYVLYLNKILKYKLYFTFFITLLYSPLLLLRDMLFKEPIFHKVQFKNK